MIRVLFLIVVPVLLLTACGGGSGVRGQDGIHSRMDVSHIPDAKPRREPRSKYGNPPSYVVHGKRYYVMDSSGGYVKKGIASWYGKKFHGRRTSSGETYDMYRMTAAHKSLPLPTYARVTNLKNGRSVVVKINDRGPFHDNRLIDLSYAAAEKLDIVSKGTGFVEVRALDPGRPEPARPTQVSVPRASPVQTTTAGPKQGNGGKIYIQVGAFSARTNAEQFKSQIPDTLGSVFIHEGWSNQRKVYRVRVGPIASVDQADDLAGAMEELGVMNYHLVVE
jgi:rare lipoprotein A